MVLGSSRFSSSSPLAGCRSWAGSTPRSSAWGYRSLWKTSSRWEDIHTKSGVGGPFVRGHDVTLDHSFTAGFYSLGKDNTVGYQPCFRQPQLLGKQRNATMLTLQGKAGCSSPGRPSVWWAACKSTFGESTVDSLENPPRRADDSKGWFCFTFCCFLQPLAKLCCGNQTFILKQEERLKKKKHRMKCRNFS